MPHAVFQRIWLPGFLFQSVLIGGGYATGRELVEFFLSFGVMGGLLGMLVATVAFSAVTAISFELARITRSYNYRHFFRQLLGRGWFLYELAYLALGLLVLAVIGAAAGELAAKYLGVSALVGSAVLMGLIGLLVFWGTSLIEKVLAGWSFLLYATYGLFVAWYLSRYGGELTAHFQAWDIDAGWLFGGIKYVGYNIAVIPVIFFCVRHMASRRDALLAGVVAGPIAMIPAVLFFLAMAASYPAVLDAPVPSDFMIQTLGVPWFSMLFYLVIFGTFVETGTAFIHAVNERIDAVWRERGATMPRWLRPVIAITALVVAVTLADRVGLIDLIARGYGALTWAFILVFFLPLVTVGLWRIGAFGKGGKAAAYGLPGD